MPRRSPYVSGDNGWSKPIIGIVACCARAASGHAAAVPPSVTTNSRRRIWIAMWASRERHTQAMEAIISPLREEPNNDLQETQSRQYCSHTRRQSPRYPSISVRKQKSRGAVLCQLRTRRERPRRRAAEQRNEITPLQL